MECTEIKKMEKGLNIRVASLWDLENWGLLVLHMVGSVGTPVFPVAYVGSEPVSGRCLMSAKALFTVVASLLFIAGSFAACV